MSEVDAVQQLQAWADDDREQADVIDWLVAVGSGDASLSGSQAETLRATADGWEEIISEIDQQAPSS